jgi:beta-galactosidase
LKERYGSIAALNRDWGNAFWSQMYNDFDQIDIPNEQEFIAQFNPHAMLDFQRWFAAETAGYIRMQADTLRKYVKNQWITTNFMSMFNQVDPALSARDLDVMTWTHYPVHGNLNEGPLGFRLGTPYEQSFMHDFMRSFNGLSGLMELQPGQVNWGDVNPWPQPGAIRMWIIKAFGAGARIVCTYRYRQPLFGAEMYHKGIVETDGVTPSPGGLEFIQAMKDVAHLRTLYKPNAPQPSALSARRTAFLVDWENRWDIDNHKQTTRWNTTDHWFRYYRALKSMMAPVDAVTGGRDFSGYPFVVAPAYQMMDAADIPYATQYIENGGNVILTARSGQKDRRGHLWEGPWAEPILPLIGAKIPRYDVLPAPNQGNVEFEGKRFTWNSWAEELEPQPGTTVIARYADQLFAGKPAATTRKLGKGTVTYIGVDTVDGEFERAVLQKVYRDAGAAPENLEPGFLVDWRDAFYVATNFTDRQQTIPAPANAKVVIGGRQVAPGGVAVWTTP